MTKDDSVMSAQTIRHANRSSVFRPSTFVITLLAIEFLDEFVFGAREAAWPLIRTDLGLNYIQIGLLLSLPSLVSSIVEPFLASWATCGSAAS